jgi:hypothetical protein
VLEELLGLGNHRPELEHAERPPSGPGPKLGEEHRPPAVELDRNGDDGEERDEDEERNGAEGGVEQALEQDGRRRQIGGPVLEEGQLREVSQLDRRSEDLAAGRDDGELNLLLAGKLDDLLDLGLHQRRRREHEPIDARDPAVIRRLLQIERLALLCDRHMEVGEELELAPDRVSDVSRGDDPDAQGRRHRAPEQTRADAGEADAGSRQEAGEHRARRLRPAGGSDLEEEREARGTDHRPQREPRDLVDGGVAKRASVAVVQREQLGDDDPRGEVEHGPGDVAGVTPAERREREAG